MRDPRSLSSCPLHRPGPTGPAFTSWGRAYRPRHPPGERSSLLRREGSGQGTLPLAVPVAQRQPQVARRRLGPVGGVELAEDVLDVELDRALGDDERAGDVRVRLAL